MTLIPKIFHQVWLWWEMPDDFKRYQISWIKNHPQWKLLTWNDANIEQLQYINFGDYALCKNYSEKSDYLRFCILLEHWWVYIDTDFECIKNVEPLLGDAEFIIWEEFFWVYNGAFMAGIPWNKIIKKIFLEFHNQLKKSTSLCRTGPIFISQFINKKDKNIKIIPWILLYPEYWLYIHTKIDKNELYASHHYAASWQGGTKKKIFFIKQKISRYYWGKYIIILMHYIILKIRVLFHGNNGFQ